MVIRTLHEPPHSAALWSTHYQFKWNQTWDETFRLIYDAAPYVKDRESSPWNGYPLIIPWSSDAQLSALLEERSPRANPYTHLQSLLHQLEPTVQKNLSEFHAFALCVGYLEAAYWRESVIVETMNQPITREAATELIQSIGRRDQTLLHKLSQDWDEGRPADSLAKSEPVFDLQPKDQLLFQWTQAAAYSAALSKDPERFYRLIAKANK